MKWVYPTKAGGGGNGEGKVVVFKSKLKWVGLFGLVLSAFSIFTHFLLARYTDGFAISEYKSSITIFSWRPIFENAADLSTATALHRRLWAPVRDLESLHPYANPRANYICDVVVVARLLNATLVIPEIQSTTSSKGISTEFKSFAYLYSEDQFIAALADDIKIVKTLPKDLKGARRKKEIPSFKVPNSASPYFYIHHVLPVLNRHSVVELVVPDGGCLQDVHTELIQHKRAWMIKRGIVKGNLTVDSAEQRLNDWYSSSRIRLFMGHNHLRFGEVFGGQKKLIPLHAMFENVVDRTSLSMPWELTKMYGREANLVDKHPKTASPPVKLEKKKPNVWKTSGPRPRPLPPPPARAKYPYNIEGWWGWVAESDNEPESTVMELRTNAHKLLWEAIDYMICVEADVFVPGFDRDGRGNPNFASLVMGHRLYQFPVSKTFRIDRKEVTRHLEEIRDHFYQANHTWITSLRRHLRKKHLVDGLTDELTKSKPLSFLSFPIPECSCSRKVSVNASSPLHDVLRTMQRCPSWMDADVASPPGDKETEEDDAAEDDSDPPAGALLFRQSGESNEGGVEMGNKEETTQMEDQEELEGGER
ncbi:hypothetical protein DH2020_037143 [Rehmannia glutinosa]|uniref:O-fucosyltransferase family protein n=1 Tax=Rehmannia glutinosa TaxID=99300 RepID=A0ABR0V1X2_REHGL